MFTPVLKTLGKVFLYTDLLPANDMLYVTLSFKINPAFYIVHVPVASIVTLFMSIFFYSSLLKPFADQPLSAAQHTMYL